MDLVAFFGGLYEGDPLENALEEDHFKRLNPSDSQTHRNECAKS